MTWIAGTSTQFGYAAAVSDIRVTVGDKHFDCLRKIYRVGRHLALGFAGSVRIGFEMVESMKKYCDSCSEGGEPSPATLVEGWPRYARQIFEAAPPDEQDLRCKLMLLGVDPADRTTLWPDPRWRWRGLTARAQASMYARSFLYSFRGPDFDPDPASCGRIVSIGSGAHVKPYARLLEELSASMNHSGWIAADWGVAAGLSFNMTQELQRNPQPSISTHLHICVVTKLGVEVVAGNNHSTAGLDGAQHEFRMPPVATTFEAFKERLRDERLSARLAVC